MTYGKHSVRYLGPRLWGTLSPDVRHAKTLGAFKNKIRGCDVSLLVDAGMASRAVPSALHSCVILSSLYQLFSRIITQLLYYQTSYF